ncbi:MAG TPA: hypothetical protein VK993_14990 [Chthoniobacterales bacterium]|nr:hypothetical protein [Chthoniobacterales bacterium]
MIEGLSPKQDKISLVGSDEHGVSEDRARAMQEANRSRETMKIVPEDWSILDIFLPPQREHPTQQPT